MLCVAGMSSGGGELLLHKDTSSHTASTESTQSVRSEYCLVCPLVRASKDSPCARFLFTLRFILVPPLRSLHSDLHYERKIMYLKFWV